MTLEQVLKFLEKRHIPQNLYMKTYDFVGGRINHLKLFVSEIVDKRLPFEVNELI
jgi:hypothetical protein